MHHLSIADLQLLHERSLMVDVFPYGVYYNLGNPDELKTINVSEGFKACVMLALMHGCYGIRFDVHGPLYRGLPTYKA